MASTRSPLMAPARLAKVCTTSFGTPVVPEVRRIHSVWCGPVRAESAGARVAPRGTTATPHTGGVFDRKRTRPESRHKQTSDSGLCLEKKKPRDTTQAKAGRH